MTTPPREAIAPIVTPTPEETRALRNAYSDEEIRSLAQQLEKSGQLGFDPGTFVKGVVTGFDFVGSPPTVTIEISGDTTTAITGVRIMSNYSPVVGDTVHIAKQGADIFVLGHVADQAGTAPSGNSGGWVKATLNAGSHNGNNNGDVYYRRILDHGSWKMQWQGGWSPSGNTVMVLGLPIEYRPPGIRTVLCARDAGGSNLVKMDFDSNGNATMVGATTAPFGSSASSSTSWESSGTTTGENQSTNHVHIDGSGLQTSATDLFHTHGGGSHSHSVDSHSHNTTVNFPTWVSFHGVEYFL